MSTETCCPGNPPAVKYDYTPTGVFEKLGDMDVYFAQGKDATRSIIVVYDIFGFTQSAKQVLQVADLLAEQTGFSVAIPDFFRGKPWPLEKMPPAPEDNFMGWVTSAASWDALKGDLEASAAWLKGKGATSLGIVGFCWGVMIACLAGASGEYKAVGGAHPSFFGQDKAIAEGVQCPVILLPTKDDNIDAAKAVLDTKPFADKNVFETFSDQGHGFVAARGEFDKPEVAAAASKAIGLMASFYKANL